MSIKKFDMKARKTHRRIVVTVVGIIVFLGFVALMHIGAGEAEWAGMSVSNLTSTNAMEFNIPKGEQGVVINWTEDPAFSSGVREGDLLKSMNNQKTRNISQFLKVCRTANLETGILLDILRDGQPLYITLNNKIGLHDKIKEALNIDPGFTGAPPADTPAGAKVALTAPVMTNDLPSPKAQGASKKTLIEGHWLGMELIPTTPELSAEYNIPPGTDGLLVDEISLESAESGILAGDMVVAVNRIATPDLVAFTEATRRVKNRRKADILVSRRGQLLEFVFSSNRTIGFSQNEAAQPIAPGAISPHRSRSQPCTTCHIIMKTGGQLPTDAGDILPNPPPIRKNAVAPHEYRGTCKTCHVILK